MLVDVLGLSLLVTDSSDSLPESPSPRLGGGCLHVLHTQCVRCGGFTGKDTEDRQGPCRRTCLWVPAEAGPVRFPPPQTCHGACCAPDTPAPRPGGAVCAGQTHRARTQTTFRTRPLQGSRGFPRATPPRTLHTRALYTHPHAPRALPRPQRRFHARPLLQTRGAESLPPCAAPSSPRGARCSPRAGSAKAPRRGPWRGPGALQQPRGPGGGGRAAVSAGWRRRARPSRPRAPRAPRAPGSARSCPARAPSARAPPALTSPPRARGRVPAPRAGRAARRSPASLP